MDILFYKRGSKKVSYFYLLLSVFFLVSYFLFPAEDIVSINLYLLIFSQLNFNLGLYCLLPEDVYGELDIVGVFFVSFPLIGSFITMGVFGLMFANTMPVEFDDSMFLLVFWISYAAGLVSGLGMYFLLKIKNQGYYLR